MKLTELANNPEHCKDVWESVTGRANIPLLVGFDEKMDATVIVGECAEKHYYAVFVFKCGCISYEVDNVDELFNSFAIVKLLTELGYETT